MAPHRIITSGLVAVAALTTFIHCSNKSSNRAAGRTCSGTQALQSIGLRGTSLEAKVLALTFDDGPGPRTKLLSRYLKEQGIQAAFFVNGMSMGTDAAEVLQQLIDDGHLVANHTENHLSLTGTATGQARLSDADIVKELVETDSKIEPFIPSKRFLFRPPYGDYDDTTFAALSTSPMGKYVGPILWDVGEKMDETAGRAADWDCWDDGADGKRTPMKTCGDLYITEIKRAGKGIVLMHDPYYNLQDPEQLGTVDMVMYMVPILKQEGFTFTRVDKVPEIEALLPPLLPEEAVDGGGPNVAPGPAGTDKPPVGSPNDNPCP
ncbi:MAG: polysaccharide deacetylase family protein [Myxococcales bacterium]|nr:polysaccharide deacetylase family protein [Myxococcales bacterium]